MDDVTSYQPENRRDPLLLVGIIGTALLHAGIFSVLWIQRAHHSSDEKPQLGIGTFVDATLVKFGKPRDLSFLPHKEGVVKTVAPEPVIKIAKEATALPIPPDQREERKEPDKVDPLKKTHAEMFKNIRDDDRPEAVSEEGGSLQGSRAGTASEATGDPYIGTLMDRIGSVWTIPTTIPDAQVAKLSASVCFNITDTGMLQKYQIEHSSGNSQFDSSLEAALGTLKEMPTPPPRFARKTFCAQVAYKK